MIFNKKVIISILVILLLSKPTEQRSLSLQNSFSSWMNARFLKKLHDFDKNATSNTAGHIVAKHNSGMSAMMIRRINGISNQS